MRILYTLFFVLGAGMLIAQPPTVPVVVVHPSSAPPSLPSITEPTRHSDADPPMLEAEVPPEYPGGIEGLVLDIQQRMTIPPVVSELELTGRVFLEMVVERDGRVTNGRVLRGVHPLVDTAMLEALRSLGPFIKPALNGGEPVRFRQMIPVPFPASETDTDALWLRGLVGTWEAQVRGERYVETWSCANGECNGRAVSYKAAEEGFVENTRIFKFHGQWLYLVAAGDAPVVCFVRTSVEGRTWVFSNVEHDFPQRIAYTLNGDDGLDAYIEGPGSEGDIRLDFNLRRTF